MQKIKYFSTFTGIGGFELGIGERGECIGFSEVDKYAVAVYQSHFPHEECENCRMERNRQEDIRLSGRCETLNGSGAHLPQAERPDRCSINSARPENYCHCKHKNYGDITRIDADALPDFDLLVGGFPCQAFSIAGKRGGFSDTRGTLFFDLARILKAKRPRLCMFENVKGLLSHDEGRTFTTIISALDELGYDIQWQVLNSKNHGVPQNRERVFIVGHLRGTPRPQVFPFIGQGNKNTTVGKSAKTTVARTLTGGGHTGGNHSGMTILQMNNPTHSNDRVYGTDGVSPTLNTMQGGNRQPFVAIPEATKKGYAEARPGQSINLAVPNSDTRRGRVSDIAQTLDTGMQQHTLTGDMRIRRLTPVECERLQGFPDNWTASVSDTQRYKQCGNAVTVNVIRDICERLLQ